MRPNLDNPYVQHNSLTLEQTEMKENKRHNVEFKLLLMRNLQLAKTKILKYQTSLSIPRS